MARRNDLAPRPPDWTMNMGMHLTPDDKSLLLKLARDVIQTKVRGEKMPHAPAGGSPALMEKAGVFVSLHAAGELRGCIGYIQPEMDLAQGVARSAENAAFEDSRFSPVRADEVDSLEIEVSVLTQPVPVGSWREIELGKHGIIMEKGGGRALFLPHVATEYRWDLPTTLTHLSKKAGLPHDAWKEGARFQVFESIVFSEKDS